MLIASAVRALFVGMAVAISACTSAAPPCPYTGGNGPVPSAGCLTVDNGRLLVVEQLNGLVGPPGGSSEKGEAAQCTAHRETWEETGLDLQPGELIKVFDTGFYLFRCHVHSRSGVIDPPWRMEIRAAYFLPFDQFSRTNWRFPDQGEILSRLVQQTDTDD